MKRSLLAVALLPLVLAACGAEPTTTQNASAELGGVNTSAEQNRVPTTRNEAAAALLPAKIRDRGTLIVEPASAAAPRRSDSLPMTTRHRSDWRSTSPTWWRARSG